MEALLPKAKTKFRRLAHVIGTPVEIVNRRVRMVGELMANEKKIEQVLSRLGVDRD